MRRVIQCTLAVISLAEKGDVMGKGWWCVEGGIGIQVIRTTTRDLDYTTYILSRLIGWTWTWTATGINVESHESRKVPQYRSSMRLGKITHAFSHAQPTLCPSRNLPQCSTLPNADAEKQDTDSSHKLINVIIPPQTFVYRYTSFIRSRRRFYFSMRSWNVC